MATIGRTMVGLKDMQDRGRMQEGMIADITIFNSDTIADTSTLKIGERGPYTRGIPYVLVNGQFVIEDSVANTKLRAGQPIRYDPITEGAASRERKRVLNLVPGFLAK